MPRLRHILLTSLFAVAIRGPATVATQTAGPEYVVEAGDTLYTIAAAFGTTIEALQTANGIVDPGTIYVGQVLVIPGFEGITGRLTIYTVEFGDTLASLSLRFGVLPDTFIRLNRIVNPVALYVGEMLIYPDESAESLKLASATTHLVAASETLVGLAAQYHVNPYAVASANGLTTTSPLFPGQPLAIPNVGGPPTGLPAPLASVSVSPTAAEQGHAVRLKARLDGPSVAEQAAALSGALGFHPLRFAKEGGTWYALQGVEAEAEPRLSTLAITVTLSSGRSVSFAQLLPVRPVVYGTQTLPSVDPLTIDPAVTEPEWAYLKSFTTQFNPTRYWQAAFARPFDGPISSPFGILRTYNNGQLTSSHTGTDFTGLPGAPIYAAAPGVVVMAEPLVVRGNATLIDHGWGVYTGYWHQSEIRVKVGDVVQAGQEIGLLGSTGRATGPNLHWELWVGSVPVDPVEWTQVTFP